MKIPVPLLTVLAGLALVTTLPAAPRYVLTDLGSALLFGPDQFYSPHINNAGQVALTRPQGNNNWIASVWTDGVWQSLGTLGDGDDRSVAVDINENGSVVGSSRSTMIVNSQRAYIHVGGSAFDLGFQPFGQDPVGIALNNAGWVSGNATTTVPGAPGGTARRALRRIGQTTTNLGVLPPTGLGSYITSFSIDIDSAGNVLGYCTGAITSGFLAPVEGGPLQNLGTYSDAGGLYLNNFPTAFNDAGQIVGYFSFSSGNPNDSEFRLPYLRSPDGAYTILGNLGGRRTTPFAITASSKIVGESDTDDSPNSDSAFYYDGQIHDLNSLVPDRKGLVLLSASGINDSGQIVGRARDGLDNGHAYLLTPIPEAPAASPTIRILGKKKLTTRAARVTVRGTATATDLARVEVKVGNSGWKKARGLAKWQFPARDLEPGRTVIRARSTDATGLRSRPAKLIVISR